MEANDYYPFGQIMPSRTYALTGAKKTRFGFNGKEKDAEVGGDDYDFGARMYDSRIGRFFSRDLFESDYPSYSGYLFAGNSPIKYIDFNGYFQLDPIFAARYPTLSLMIEQNLPRLKDNKSAKDAFMQITGYDEALFNMIITPGSGPFITPTRPCDEIGDYLLSASTSELYSDKNSPAGFGGLYDYYEYPDNLLINHKYLDELELSMQSSLKTGNYSEVYLNMFIVSIYIMHEATHYGFAAHYHQTEKYDLGAYWEEYTFGKRFSYQDVNREWMNIDDIKTYYNENSKMPVTWGLTYRPWTSNNGMTRMELDIQQVKKNGTRATAIDPTIDGDSRRKAAKHNDTVYDYNNH